jgi:hypothetical protein
MQLVYDEEITVKISSIDLMIRILDLLTDDIKEKTISKLFLEWMDSHDVLVLERISAIFGELLQQMSDIFISNKQRLIQTIQKYKVRPFPLPPAMEQP